MEDFALNRRQLLKGAAALGMTGVVPLALDGVAHAAPRAGKTPSLSADEMAAVDTAMGKKGSYNEAQATYTVPLPRNDLKMTIKGDSIPPSTNPEVFTMNADGTGVTALAFGNNAVYSPDGAKVLFIRMVPVINNPAVQFEFDIYQMNADGTGQTLLTSNVYPSPPTFSPDGSKIAFTTWAPNGTDLNISVMNRDGTGRTPIVNGVFSTSGRSINYNPTFSPDGSRIAFESNRSPAPSGVFEDLEIWAVNVDGTNLTQLTFFTPLPIGISSNRTPSWGPGAVGIPAVVGLTLNPATVISGNSSQGTVTLSGPAPLGDALVALTSASPSALVPASVTIPAGATSTTFPVTTITVSVTAQANITAAYGGVSQSAALTLLAPDKIAITRDEYTISQKQLRLETTSTSLSATLKAYVTATGALLGTLTNVGGGKYQLQTIWPTNPQNITVKSSLGGVATGAVTPHN